MQQYTELELVWDGRAMLGEGPVWDHRSQEVIWVDIDGMRVHRYQPAAGAVDTLQLNQKIGAVVPRASGGFVAAMEHGFHFLGGVSGEAAAIADPEAHLPGNRFNDGKCDTAGRFWAGTMKMNETGAAGSLYCLEPDGTLRTVLSGAVTISNGIGWSPDNRTMYYIDTPTKKVVAYSYDAATGAISEPRRVVTIPPGEGSPDGMAVDAAGNLWVALWGGWQVGCWNPATGEKLATIPVPVERTSSCAFGGEQLDELYITTASVGMREEDWAKQPHAGGLFRIKLPVQGPRANFYGG
ncbi:SMP-30/gluconolactonase/LRE family protein [Paenibacillus oryzisoli]|uniref:SMP-30/gluconolactonase/LRE family protein n=1 Tax=Paenibacillus oryzisoli TaxID=1850517 RepID=UPI003D2933E5